MQNPYNFKVGMLILIEPNLEEAVEFYEKLGFKKIFHIKNSWAEFSINGVKLGLCPTAQPMPERHTGIVLEVDDLYGAYEKLLQQGIKFLDKPKEAEHGVMVSFIDPGNQIIDLYQPTPEKLRKIVEDIVKRKCCKEASNCECDAKA